MACCSGGCVLHFCGILTLGFGVMLLWLLVSADEPRCYVEYIYVPVLNKSLNHPQDNNAVFFTLRVVNRNFAKGVKYDAVRLSFGVFVGPNATHALGNATVEGFYLDSQAKAFKRGSLHATAGNLTVPVNGRVLYRVDFVTTVRYTQFLYKKRYRLWGGANVEIGDSGLKVCPKPLRLGDSPPIMIQSGAPKLCI